MEFITLSRLMSDIEPKLQFAFYKRFKQAVRTGELEAVPTTGNFPVPRSKSPLQVPEHLLQREAHTETWKQSQLEQLQQPKTPSRRVAVQLSELESGAVTFSEVAARYRASITPRSRTATRNSTTKRKVRKAS